MKWFRHQTGSHDDEKLVALLEDGGLRAYGCYWFVLEVIAAQMGKDDERCSVSYPLKRWASLCNEKPSLFLRMVEKLSAFGLIEVASRDFSPSSDPKTGSTRPEVDVFCRLENENGGQLVRKSNSTSPQVVEISCPNLLKYRDEYSVRKASRHSGKSDVSGECRDNVGRVSAPEQSITKQNTSHQNMDEPTPAVEAEGSQNPRPSKAAFEAKLKEAFDGVFWGVYPRRVAKAAALKAFGKIFPSGQAPEEKQRRWENMSFHLAALRAEFAGRDKAELKYCPYPATWLNQTDFDSPPEDDAVPMIQTWEEVPDDG